MTPRDLVFTTIGAVIGAAATYVLMDYMFEKELDDIYGDLEDTVDVQIEKSKEVVFNIEEAQNDAAIIIDDVDEMRYRKGRMIEGAERIVTDAPEEEEFSEGVFTEVGNIFDDEDSEDEDPQKEDEDMHVVNEYNGIFIIPNDLVSERQVVGEYNHDDGSVEVSKMMSVKSESFDDIIENDALYSLINDEAYDILMNSEPSSESDKRIIAVRNNVINLDFVIAY